MIMAKIDRFWTKNRSNWLLFCVLHLCLAWKKCLMTFVIIFDHVAVITACLIRFFDQILHENPSKCAILCFWLCSLRRFWLGQISGLTLSHFHCIFETFWFRVSIFGKNIKIHDPSVKTVFKNGQNSKIDIWVNDLNWNKERLAMGVVIFGPHFV